MRGTEQSFGSTFYTVDSANHADAEEGHMDPQFLAPLIPIVAIIAVAAVKITRLRATRPESPSADVIARIEGLEHGLQVLQEDLAETQERLDFAERLLSSAREERRIGS
jgi:hypothetical protein